MITKTPFKTCHYLFYVKTDNEALPEKCLNTAFFWSVFSRFWTDYGDILRKSLHLVQIRESTNQKISVFRLFSLSEARSRGCIFRDKLKYKIQAETRNTSWNTVPLALEHLNKRTATCLIVVLNRVATNFSLLDILLLSIQY